MFNPNLEHQDRHEDGGGHAEAGVLLVHSHHQARVVQEVLVLSHPARDVIIKPTNGRGDSSVLGPPTSAERPYQGATKRCCLSWLTNSALVYEHNCGGRGGVVGSQPMSTAVHRSPNA